MTLPVYWMRQDFLAVDHLFERAIEGSAKRRLRPWLGRLDYPQPQIIPVAHDVISDGLIAGPSENGIIDTHASARACSMTSTSKDFCFGGRPGFFAFTAPSSRGTSENSPGCSSTSCLSSVNPNCPQDFMILEAIDLENRC